MSSGLAWCIRPGLSPAAAALLVVASTPGIDTVLLASSSLAHWQEAEAIVRGEPLLSLDDLHGVLDVLAV